MVPKLFTLLLLVGRSAATLTLGQQYGALHNAGGRIDVPAILSVLNATNANSYSFLLSRSGDYLDLVSFLGASAAQKIRVWVTLFSPSHTCKPGTYVGKGCAQSVPRDSPLTPWNETALFNASLCPVVSNATTDRGCHDYVGWGHALGLLGQQFPNLVALHLDDFSDESNLEGGAYGIYTPALLAAMRQRLSVGGVKFVGGLYYTRYKLNHTFTLDVYPWLASSVDGFLLYFLNSKQGFGPCKPGCAGMPTKPGWQKYCDCCLAGSCAEATAPNVIGELADVRARLRPDQTLLTLVFGSGSSCGHPTVKYTYDVLEQLLGPRGATVASDGAFMYIMTNRSSDCTNPLTNLGCTVAEEFAKFSRWPSSPVAPQLEFAPPVLVGEGTGSDAAYAFPPSSMGPLVAGPNDTFVVSGDGARTWNATEDRSHFLDSHAYLFASAAEAHTLQETTVDNMEHIFEAPMTNVSSEKDGFTEVTWSASTASVQKVRGSGVIRYVELPKPVWYFRTNSGNVIVAEDAANDKTRFLQTCNVLFVSDAPAGARPHKPAPTSVVLFASADGLLWRFVSVVMAPEDSPQSVEGPNESALTQLASGALLVVVRIDGGDGGNLKPFAWTVSSDHGTSWSAPTTMRDSSGRVIGAARPKFLRVGSLLLLTGGRPGIFVWAAVDDDSILQSTSAGIRVPAPWQPFNIAAMHNAGLAANESDWKFGPTIVAARNFSEPYQSGGYQSLMLDPGGVAVVVYSRRPVPGFEQAPRVFSMRMTAAAA